jgi:GAF domain-containing protein
VSPDTLSAGIAVIRQLIAGSDSSAIESGLAAMRTAAAAEARGGDFTAFEEQVHALVRERDEAALNERGLSLLIETTHDLAKTLDLGDLLRTVVARARSLAATHLAWVAILDKQARLFRTVAAEGHLSSDVPEMTSEVDKGAVGLIMKSKSFFETQDYLRDSRFQHLPGLDRAFENEGIVALAGFPILHDGEAHGFLFVANRAARKLSGREISILGSFALHAGVAIRNANLFSQLSAALSAAEHNRNALVNHIKRVEASAVAHDEMTTLLATGAELRQFLQRLAVQIGGAVLLYDADLRIRDEIEASDYRGRIASDLRDGNVDLAILAAASAQSRHTGRSVVVLSTGDEECRAVALHSGTGRGEILVLCHGHELDAIDIRNFERSAVALTIAKLWNEKREAERQMASSTLVRHLVLVSPADRATVSAIADRLNLGGGEPILLCLVTISGLDQAGQGLMVRECAAETNVLVDFLNDTHVAAGREDAVRSFAAAVLDRRKGWQAGGIISEPISDLTDAAACFSRLSRSLRALRRIEPVRHFIEYSEAGLFARIVESQDADRLVRDVRVLLKPLERLSRRQAAELKRTLLTYFDCQHNLTRTATELGLHINTVRQRLNAVRDASGGWDDPVRALELHFALRLEAIFHDPPPASPAS